MELWEAPEGLNFKERFQLKHLKHTEYSLSRKQRKLLEKQGHKYKELMDGTIRPLSPKQKHFVDMCNDLVEPNDEWEKIWKSYWSTVKEENRLEKIHRSELKKSPRNAEYLRSRWVGNISRSTPSLSPSVPEEKKLREDSTRKCRVCRGSGMKGDGDSCDTCNGWGWLH